MWTALSAQLQHCQTGERCQRRRPRGLRSCSSTARSHPGHTGQCWPSTPPERDSALTVSLHVDRPKGNINNRIKSQESKTLSIWLQLQPFSRHAQRIKSQNHGIVRHLRHKIAETLKAGYITSAQDTVSPTYKQTHAYLHQQRQRVRATVARAHILLDAACAGGNGSLRRPQRQWRLTSDPHPMCQHRVAAAHL